MKRAIGYIRVSEMRDEKWSPESQRKAVREEAERIGAPLAEIYEDLDINSAHMEQAGTFERLMEAAREGDTIISNDFTRVGRDQLETLKRIKYLTMKGCDLISLEQRFDMQGVYAGAFVGFMAGIAEADNKLRGLKIKAAMAEKIKAGQWAGGPLPYGYRYGEREAESRKAGGKCLKVEIDEERAATVRLIFERAGQGNGRVAIAKTLNRGGAIPPGKKNPAGRTCTVWHPKTVNVLLNNTAYIGEREFEGETYPVNLPPIIARREWDRAKAAFVRKPTPKRPRYLLSGMLKCSLCDGPMVHRPQVGKFAPQYQCYGLRGLGTCKGVTITHHLVEAAIIEEFFKRVESEDYSEKAKAHVFDQQQSPELATLRKRLTDARGQHDRIVGLYQDGKIDRGAFERRADPLEAQAREIEREIALIEAGNVLPPVWEGNIREDWEILSADERRHALDLFIERVVIEPGNGKRGAERVKIEWR